MQNGKNGDTKHHIIPRSRGGPDEEYNITNVKGKWHEIYHLLFGNKTPEEVVEFLNKTFFGDKYIIFIHEKYPTKMVKQVNETLAN